VYAEYANKNKLLKNITRTSSEFIFEVTVDQFDTHTKMVQTYK